MKRPVVPLAAALLALVACTVNVPEPTPVDANGDDGVLADLRAGRSLYVDKCSGCHGLYSVERFADAEWKGHVQEMLDLRKVRLLEEDRTRLELYLTRVNGRP